jgi:hypothetical protein
VRINLLDILKFDGFRAQKREILRPRWIPTPVLPALSLCRCCRHYPVQRLGVVVAHLTQLSAFPDNVVGSACTSSFLEDCSAFTHVAARTLARSAICDLLHRMLQTFCYLHDCSGCFRLERLPGGACTHWKAPPCHGAHAKRPLQMASLTPIAGAE